MRENWKTDKTDFDENECGNVIGLFFLQLPPLLAAGPSVEGHLLTTWFFLHLLEIRGEDIASGNIRLRGEQMLLVRVFLASFCCPTTERIFVTKTASCGIYIIYLSRCNMFHYFAVCRNWIRCNKCSVFLSWQSKQTRRWNLFKPTADCLDEHVSRFDGFQDKIGTISYLDKVGLYFLHGPRQMKYTDVLTGCRQWIFYVNIGGLDIVSSM